MNLLICNDMSNMIYLKNNIKLDKFNITSSEESAKILCNKKNFELLIYDKDLDDIAFFKKRISLIYSINQIKTKINSKKSKEDLKEKNIKNTIVNNQNNIIPNNITQNNSVISSNKSPINSIANINNMFKAIIVQNHLNKSDKKNNTISYDLPSITVNNKIFAFTSCKGGIGQTSLIAYIANNCKFKKLILDLNFYDGGSDLSYMLGLPKIPHLGTYIKDDMNTFENHLISLKNNTFVLQAPPLVRLVENFSTDHLLSIFSSFDGTILIDLPNETSQLKEFILNQSDFIYILTTSHLGELSRIKNCFFRYKNKSLVLSNTIKNNELLENINLNYKILKDFEKDGAKFVSKDIFNHNS